MPAGMASGTQPVECLVRVETSTGVEDDGARGQLCRPELGQRRGELLIAHRDQYDRRR